MRTSPHNCRLSLAPIAIAALIFAPDSIAQNDQHDLVRSALVYVVAEGIQSEQSAFPGVPSNTQQTGFFIDPHGYVATTYHLLTNLGDIEPDTLKIRVSTERFSSVELPASIDFQDPDHDVLILKVPTLGQTYTYLPVLSRPRNHIDSNTVVYTSGYPAHLPYKTGDGKVSSFDGPAIAQFLWASTLRFEAGQSGSPIYLKNGSLVGIAKGQQRNFPQNNYIISSRYIPRNYVALEARSAVDNLMAATFQSESTSGRVDDAELIGNLLVKASGLSSAQFPDEIRETRETQFRTTNPHCRNSSPVRWFVDPTAGWTIDFDTIDVDVFTDRAGSTFTGYTQVQGADGQSRIQLNGVVRNSGQCIEVLGTTVARDARGNLGINVKYDEVRRDRSDFNEFANISLYSGVVAKLALPDTYEQLSLTFVGTDGREFVVDDEGKIDGLNVDVDSDLGELRVEPAD